MEKYMEFKSIINVKNVEEYFFMWPHGNHLYSISLRANG